MTIIDLYTKMQNGEEVPKKVKWKDIVFELDDNEYYYENKEELELYSILEYFGVNEEIVAYKALNIEIEEILEENKIEKLKSLNNVGNAKDLGEFQDKQQLNNHLLKDKVNQLIDEINKLKVK